MSGRRASRIRRSSIVCFPADSKRREAFERRGALVFGDVHPEVEEVAGALSPVPGGVGPLTIAMLLKNTVRAAQMRLGVEPRSRACVQVCVFTMLRVALTGGIATGKSHVLQEFRKRGVPCLDADDLAHGVTTAGTEATAQIAERFGHEVLDSSGAVDRHKLGAIVFADPSARRELEEIVHPAVYRAIAAGMRAFELLEHSPIVDCRYSAVVRDGPCERLRPRDRHGLSARDADCAG